MRVLFLESFETLDESLGLHTSIICAQSRVAGS